jgi:hypothetical protein
MPLRVPSGWTVSYNTFRQVEPKFKTYDDVSWDFKEDMLVIENARYQVLLDLGWYPGHTSHGAFGLRAVRLLEEGGGDWDKPLQILRTRSSKKVVLTIERWLAWYGDGNPAPLSKPRRPASSRKVR